MVLTRRMIRVMDDEELRDMTAEVWCEARFREVPDPVLEAQFDMLAAEIARRSRRRHRRRCSGCERCLTLGTPEATA
jgi:hypothetical protein